MDCTWLSAGCGRTSPSARSLILSLVITMVSLTLPSVCTSTIRHAASHNITTESTTAMSHLLHVGTGSTSAVNFLRPPVSSLSNLLTSSPSRAVHKGPIHRIGVMFRNSSFDSLRQHLITTIEKQNIKALGKSNTTALRLEVDTLKFLNNACETMIYVCDYIFNHNVTAILAIGSRDAINTAYIATRYLGIPLLGYSLDPAKPSAGQGGRPLYLQLDPDPAILSSALVRLLSTNDWHYASLISQDDYASDSLAQSLVRLTHHPNWHLEDHIRIPTKATLSGIEHKLLSLLENKSRVIILHCSPELAWRIFMVAEQNEMTGAGFAWFVTEENIVRSQSGLQHYPVGLLAIAVDSFHPEDVLSDAVAVVASATQSFLNDYGDNSSFAESRSCYSGSITSVSQRTLGDTFHRYIRDASLPSSNGTRFFNREGQRAQANFQIYNLVQGRSGRKLWKQIGSIKNNTIKLSSIVWPGASISGPIASGSRRLRVVTNLVEPFVMEAQAYFGSCTTSLKCLRVSTKDGEMLDAIFKDAQSGIVNASRPYEVSCCQGLSIMLLERLARDLDLEIQLYITADNRYGDLLGDSWNGMVEDLLNGAAHMAVSAFSVTKARSRVIDFTHPYFYSSYSILVSERQRSPPIYAFMEPFDSWVWISIAISATVVAVALSLLEWNSPFGLNPWGRKRKTNYTLGSGLNMVYAIFFQHTIKTKSPKAWPSKWLQNYWAGASIFIYSSYTANLAAFLAGKNSGVTITGIHDPKLLEPGRQIGILMGTASEDFVRSVNPQLLAKADRKPSTLPIEDALGLLMNGSIHAYLDDTPVLEYARTTMDSRCKLRLVGRGFGEDSYGIGLPTNSWLKEPLTNKIMEYHDSGYIEDLTDLYFRRSRCKDLALDGQLQGEASSMKFNQHAGLYLLLLVGVFVCILLMFVEHATFKWMVPYWRKKPGKSFWKSLSMMFWSQRLYRIITSEELVSPHHSAREMIQVVRNRDFTKLFQKSVRKQENKARNKKNLFSVVEQLQWKRRREERLSQNPSTQTECSQDSENSPNMVSLNLQRSADGPSLLPFHQTSHESAGSSSTACSTPATRPQRWILSRSTALPLPVAAKAPTSATLHNPFPSASHVPQVRVKPRLRRQFSRSQSELESSVQSPDTPDYSASKSDDELLGQSDPDTDPLPGICVLGTDPNGYKLVDGSDPDHEKGDDETSPDQEEQEIRYSNPLFLAQNSSSEDNLIGSGVDSSLPNGMFLLSPRGEVYARSASGSKNIIVHPNQLSNLKNFSRTLPETLKTLPLTDHRVKSPLPIADAATHKRSLGDLRHDEISQDLEESNLSCLSKEELYLMWKTSEREWNKKLKKALSEKMELESRLAKLAPHGTT